MRAVKGSLGYTPFTRNKESWKALARANGTSRRASGWAGEKSSLFEYPVWCTIVFLNMLKNQTLAHIESFQQTPSPS